MSHSQTVPIGPGMTYSVPMVLADVIAQSRSYSEGDNMEKLYKSFELKSVSDNGEVEGYASTWTTEPDSYGDIVIKGAFTETLEKKAQTGHPFPLCFNHDLDQIIGAVKEIEEDDFGLRIKASFLSSALAQEKRELVKEGIVWQFSFAYNILESEAPTEEEKKAGILQKLTKLDLFEVSLVPVPANQTAVVTEIKSESDIEVKDAEVEVKAGRRNSAKDADAIKEAIKLLQGVLGEFEEVADQEDGEDDPEVNEASEEQKESNPLKEMLLEYIKSSKTEE